MAQQARHDGTSLPPRRQPTQPGQPGRSASRWDTMTVAELRQWAKTHGVELGDAVRKAELVDRLTAATGSDTIPEGG